MGLREELEAKLADGMEYTIFDCKEMLAFLTRLESAEGVVAAIDELREGEATELTLTDDSDFNGRPFCVVEVSADWNSWGSDPDIESRYAGERLADALAAGVSVKRKACKFPEKA